MPVLRSHHIRLDFLALIGLAVMLWVAMATVPATSDAESPWQKTNEYSTSCNNDDSIDPVGVLFRGKRASAVNARDEIKFHSDWNYDVHREQHLHVKTGPGLWECREADRSVANKPDFPPSGRFHTRLWFVPVTNGGNDLWTVGTPHHEDLVLSCPGHAVDQNGPEGSGFDRGRHSLREWFETSRHTVETGEKWGNTETAKQCDGGYAGSDGYGLTIYLNALMRPQAKGAHISSTGNGTLKGALTTEESTTEWWFAYGPNPSQGESGYPNKTAVESISGPAEIDVNKPVSGLDLNTTYYMRMFARNQDGEVEEGDEIQVRACPSPVSLDENDPSSGPRTAAHCSNGNVDVFFREPNGNLGHHWWNLWNPEGWAIESRPASIASDAAPRVIAQPSGNGNVDIFYRDTNGNLGHQWWNSFGAGWGVETRSASMGSEPHVVEHENGTVDVFYRTTNGNLGHQWWNPAIGWASETRSASMASDPDVVLHDNGVVDIFYREPNGNLGHHWWVPANGWFSASVSASMASRPQAVTQHNGVVDIFYRDTSGNLGHQWWVPENGWFSATTSASMDSSATPQVTAQDNGVVDIFYRTTNGNLGHQWWAPSTGWTSETLGASLASDPHVVAQPSGNGNIDVFFREPNGNLGQRWWSPSSGWGATSLNASMASDPHVVEQSNGAVNVVFRTTTGDLGDYWWTPSTGWVDEIRPADIAARPPKATTGSTSSVGDEGATVKATVNPEAAPTSYYFEYGTTTSYGSKAPASPQDLGYGTADVSVSRALSGLSAGTTYHYRVVATSPEGTSYGQDKTFETESVEPSDLADSLSAMPVREPFDGSAESKADFESKWAALGWADGTPPEGSDTSTGWGPIESSPTIAGISYETTIVDGGDGVAAVARMTGNPGLGSRYLSLWLDMQTPAGTRSGYELRFTVASSNVYDVKLSRWVSGNETVLASKSGYSFVNGGSLAIVDYGNKVSAWTDTGSGFVKQLGATDGTFSGGKAGMHASGNSTRLENFKAGPLGVLPPTAVTQGASGIDDNAATLHGLVNPNGAATSYRFEYVGQADFESEGWTGASQVPAEPKAVGSGKADVGVEETIEGLEQDTRYHYRLSAFNELGTSFGYDHTVTTPPATPHFASAEYPAQIAGSQQPGDEVVLNLGEEMEIECETTQWSGEQTAASNQLSLNAAFSGCEDAVTGSKVTFEMNSCHYVFQVANAGPPYSGGLGVQCNETGDSIDVHVPALGIVLNFESQSPVGTVSYENGSEGPSDFVDASLSVDKLQLGCEGSSYVCKLLQEASGGEYGELTGGIELEALDGEGAQIGLSVDGEEIDSLLLAGEESTDEASQPRFETAEYPVQLTGTQQAGSEVVLGLGEGEMEIRCETAQWSGEQAAASNQIALGATLEGCKETQSVSAASVDMNSCGYLFTVDNVGPPYAGGLGVQCAEEGDAIEVHVPALGVTVAIAAQSAAGTVEYENQSEGATRSVEAGLSVQGLQVSCEGSKFICGLLQGDGEMSGAVELG